MSLLLLQPDWPAPVRVRAAMSTRLGGVSEGPFASLNLGVAAGDDPRHVEENRRRLAMELDLPGPPAWLKQVHGTQVVDAAGVRQVVEADASFATRSGAVCVVQAADCLPVLFCDDAGSVVAAAHAGWRGLAAGVLEATVDALPVAPSTLMAWLGPAIGPRSFEVGAEVREAFRAADPASSGCFVPQVPGKYLADLYALARRRLARHGVQQIFGGSRCTLREPRYFFSHRRDGRCGRMAALIWIAAMPQEMLRNR